LAWLDDVDISAIAAIRMILRILTVSKKERRLLAFFEAVRKLPPVRWVEVGSRGRRSVDRPASTLQSHRNSVTGQWQRRPTSGSPPHLSAQAAQGFTGKGGPSGSSRSIDPYARRMIAGPAGSRRSRAGALLAKGRRPESASAVTG
jgi:hypothetical protein